MVWHYRLSTLCVLSLTLVIRCGSQQGQPWDDAIGAVKKDITDLAERIKGSALLGGLTRAIRAYESHGIPTARHNVTVVHIIEELNIKRLYRVMAANHQFSGFVHEVLYWIPTEKRPESALRDIATLQEVLPTEAVRVMDLHDFLGSERVLIESESCSGNKCYDLLLGKDRQKRGRGFRAEIDDSSSFWSLDIDMNWVGNLEDILEKLTPLNPSRSALLALLNVKDDTEPEVTERCNVIDYLGVCVGDEAMRNRNKNSFDKVFEDFEKLTSEASQALNDAVDVLAGLLMGNDSMSQKQKQFREEELTESFCWPEISRFSGRFLDILYNSTYSAENITKLRKRGSDYWELVDDNQLLYRNILESGLKSGLLARDFSPDMIPMNENPVCVNVDVCQNSFKNDTAGNPGIISLSEFEYLSTNFNIEAAEPFVFEKKAGILFRNIDGTSGVTKTSA
jgi:hypothetical protein